MASDFYVSGEADLISAQTGNDRSVADVKISSKTVGTCTESLASGGVAESNIISPRK